MSQKIPQIVVLDNASEQILYSCPIEDSQKAYAYAAEMEQMGIDVKVINPTLADTLSASLGLSREEQMNYQDSLEEEIEQHEGSCCFEDINAQKIQN